MPPVVLLVVGWIGGGALYAAWGASPSAVAPLSFWHSAGVVGALVGTVVTWMTRSRTPSRTRSSLRARATARATARSHSPWIAFAAPVTLAVASWLSADARTRYDATCVRALEIAHSRWLVRLDDAAAPKRRVHGTVVMRAPRACVLPVALTVARGEAVAGAYVAVTGTLSHTHTGHRIQLRVAQAEITPTGRVSLLAAWRARTGARIHALFGENAPVVQALITADQRDIPPSMREQYATVGLVHLLSISGLHVAIIAGALRTIGMALRLSRATAGMAALLTVFAYVLVLGVPAPATRAAVMLLVVIGTTLLDRPVHPWTALALGVVVPTADPRTIGSLGWQLSAAGMAALVAARALLRRWHQQRLRLWRRGWRRTLLQEVVMGTMASVVTLPLVVWSFGRVSLIAPVSNLLASPVVTLLQPMLFVAIVLDSIPGADRLAPFVADASRVPLAALHAIASTLERIPVAALSVSPTWYTVALLSVAVSAVVVATAQRRVMPAVRVAVGALVVAVWLPVVLPGPRRFELHLLDVGQGDAIALRSPRGRWVLVDAGRAWDGGDAGRRTVVPYVRRLGGEVAAFVLTHGDADHAGGAASVLEVLRPAIWWDPGFVMGSAVYRRTLAAAHRRGVAWQRVHTGDTLNIDGVRVTALAPDSLWTAAQRDPNEASVVLLVQYGRHRFLLTGDAESGEEAWMVERWGDALRADVLKVGHHGSRTSTTPAFLAAVRPTAALISVGAGNRYGHPSPPVLQALAAHGVLVARTDEDGGVVIASDGRRLIMRTTTDAQWMALP